MSRRTGKNPGALDDIREAINKGSYLDSIHAYDSISTRDIDRLDIRHAVNCGKRNTKHDKYSEEHQEWSYAIEGPTCDGDRNLRVIMALHHDVALLITVYEIKGDERENAV